MQSVSFDVENDVRLGEYLNIVCMKWKNTTIIFQEKKSARIKWKLICFHFTKLHNIE